MSKYKCIKSFSIPEIDFNNFETGELLEVKAGETYEIYSDNYIGGDVHLENENHWIEITYLLMRRLCQCINWRIR